MKPISAPGPFALILLGLVTLVQIPAIAADSKRFVCPPCSSNCHDVIYDKAGQCPKCHMTLMEQSQLRNVAIVVWDGVELLDFAGPGEVFADARIGDKPVFNVFTVGLTSDPVISQGFLKMSPTYSISNCPQPDVLIIPGGGTQPLTGNSEFMAWVKKASNNTEMIITVCTGAFVAAKAGLLDDLEATTWHGAVDALRREAKDTKVHADRRFVDNGDIITTAGVSAGIDGALQALAHLAGPDIAAKTARYMEYDYWPDLEGRTASLRLQSQIKKNPDSVLAQLESLFRAGVLDASLTIGDPAYFPLHENPRFRDLMRRFCNRADIDLVMPDEPGIRLTVSGKVADANGKPVERAQIYAFHTDLQGNYSSSGGNVGSMGDSLNPRIFGYMRTSADGSYHFRTIHPGQYPGDGPPAHIHFQVVADGFEKLVTELMFEGDSRLNSQNRASFERANFTICKPDRTPNGDESCKCDFVLRNG